MIIQKLKTIKHSANLTIDIEMKRVAAANSIESLLDQIDFSAEVVPTNNLEKLVNLITLLKGEELVQSEVKLVEEIVKT